MDLLSTVNRNAPPITNGQLERYEDLHNMWIDIKISYDKVLSNISSINSMLMRVLSPTYQKVSR